MRFSHAACNALAARFFCATVAISRFERAHARHTTPGEQCGLPRCYNAIIACGHFSALFTAASIPLPNAQRVSFRALRALTYCAPAPANIAPAPVACLHFLPTAGCRLPLPNTPRNAAHSARPAAHDADMTTRFLTPRICAKRGHSSEKLFSPCHVPHGGLSRSAS